MIGSDSQNQTKGDDGRIYFLIIEPEIVETKLPTQFKIEHLAIYDWDFPSSPVILDGEIYVGRVGMSGGSLVGIALGEVLKTKHFAELAQISITQSH